MRSIRAGGWPVVLWSSVLVAAIVTSILAIHGTGDSGVRAVIRASAGTSLLLFLSAFVASSLSRLWPSQVSRWMLTNRRYLGVSFAVSHFVHFAAILVLASMSTDLETDWVTRIGGGLAYAFIAAMTATSFDRSAAWLGPRLWRRLHTAGAYCIWFIFFQSYLLGTIRSPAHAPLAALLLAAIGIRGLAWHRLRHRSSSFA